MSKKTLGRLQKVELREAWSSEAAAFLADKEEERGRLERVADLIAGFETPYGMELLASVHWVAVGKDSPAGSADQAIERVHAWSERKRGMMKPRHIRIAWDHLRASGWL